MENFSRRDVFLCGGGGLESELDSRAESLPSFEIEMLDFDQQLPETALATILMATDLTSNPRFRFSRAKSELNLSTEHL